MPEKNLEPISFRADGPEKTTFEMLALIAGKKMSPWVREVVIERANEEVAALGGIKAVVEKYQAVRDEQAAAEAARQAELLGIEFPPKSE